LGVVCVFAEPQFSSKLVTLLTEGTDAKPAHLDPLGALSKPGPEHYPNLIRQLAASFRGCLSP
ncbi:MAG: zinc ABC transporter substrate-binding protein, partial [Rhizobiales bacterium]|nr:zinc ABC transporter substrate-binding protein [Hyphomicrobiales bacterium]